MGIGVFGCIKISYIDIILIYIYTKLCIVLFSMDKKQKSHKNNKTATQIPAADSFTNYEHSGWLSKHFADGLFKKRWRKRYCVLSSGTLYLYEKQASKGTDASSIAIELGKFSDCTQATSKESKKSPFTIVLEPAASNNNTEMSNKKHDAGAAREFLFADDENEMKKWISVLKESLSLSCTGPKPKLEHVTKSRARPPRSGGGNRRPPTKQHLKERALTSEIAMEDFTAEPEKTKKETKSRIPAVAMKPPGKPMVPKKPRSVSNQSDTPEESKSKDSPPAESKKDDSDAVKENRKSAPMSPSAALKPKPKPEPIEEISPEKDANVEDNQSEKLGEPLTPDSEDKSKNVSSKSAVSSPTEGSGSVESASEKSERDGAENVHKPGAKSPPMLPPVALKPKPRLASEISEDTNSSVGENQSSETTVDSGSNNLKGTESLQAGNPSPTNASNDSDDAAVKSDVISQSEESKSADSSPAKSKRKESETKSPPQLPPAALKPKVKAQREDVSNSDITVDADKLQTDVKLSDRSTKPPAPPASKKPKLLPKPSPTKETHENNATDSVQQSMDSDNSPSILKRTSRDITEDDVNTDSSLTERCSPQPSPNRDKPPPSPSRASKPKLQIDKPPSTVEVDFTTKSNNISTPVSSDNISNARARRSLTLSPSAPTETVKRGCRSQTL